MVVKLLTEHNLEFLGLRGGCRGSSESTLVKMRHCWKLHGLAQISANWALLWRRNGQYNYRQTMPSPSYTNARLMRLTNQPASHTSW